MRHSPFRHLAAAGAVALITASSLAACGAQPISPRPATRASAPASANTGLGNVVPSVAPSVDLSVAPTAARRPTRPVPARSRSRTPGPAPSPPASTTSTSTCFGAVRHDLDLNTTELALIKSMCFHTGGVLRLQGIGPGLVTSAPESLVSQSYEAAVVDIRFVRAGTVTVTIPMEQQTYTITVVVVS
jgi:hypothetical protein